MKEDILTIRTHHLMCMSRGAAQNSDHPTLAPVVEEIRANPDRQIRVVIGPDDICLPCPHWDGSKCNSKPGMEEKNQKKDAAFLKALDISEGEVFNARRLYDIIAERITLEDMRAICPTCKPDECYPAAKDPSVIFGKES